MNLKALRLAADFAAHRQHLRYDQMKIAWSPWRHRLSPARHPLATVAACFVGGALAARFSKTTAAGSVGTLLGLASFALRSPFSSLLVASIATARTKKRPSSSETPQPAISEVGRSTRRDGAVLLKDNARRAAAGDEKTEPRQGVL